MGSCAGAGCAAGMRLEFPAGWHDSWMPAGKVGEGVSPWSTCEDAIAIYHEVMSRGIEMPEPRVGNAMWITTLSDPDGYRLNFEISSCPAAARIPHGPSWR
mgnify:CR=1 FL=1